VRGDYWEPVVDVFETEKALVVRAELAGVASSALRVTVDGEWLLIRGERSPAAGTSVRRLHQMEIATGPFERRLRIPLEFERDHVSANLEEGVLTVTLPKRAPATRRIEIQREPQE
jgi:HSP20 family protein